MLSGYKTLAHSLLRSRRQRIHFMEGATLFWGRWPARRSYRMGSAAVARRGHPVSEVREQQEKPPRADPGPALRASEAKAKGGTWESHPFTQGQRPWPERHPEREAVAAQREGPRSYPVEGRSGTTAVECQHPVRRHGCVLAGAAMEGAHPR